MLLGLGLALEPAQAGDRKSTDRVHRSDEMSMSREVRSVSSQRDFFGSQSVTLFEARQSSSSSKQSEEDAAHQKPFSFFNIKSKVGDIAVQPATGVSKGVQLSLEFREGRRKN